jgi:hypothetical protein
MGTALLSEVQTIGKHSNAYAKGGKNDEIENTEQKSRLHIPNLPGYNFPALPEFMEHPKSPQLLAPLYPKLCRSTIAC